MTYDNKQIGAAHATVEKLISAVFDGDRPMPTVEVRIVGAGDIEIWLSGPESVLFKLTALAMFAVALDDDGPAVTPAERYTTGWQGETFVWVRLACTQDEIDAEMAAL